MAEVQYWAAYDLAGRRQIGWLADSQLDSNCELWAVRILNGQRSTEWLTPAECDVNCFYFAAYDLSSRRAMGWSPIAPSVVVSFVTDSFVGADATLLQAHVGELGATWTKHPSATGDAQLITNRVRNQNLLGLYYASGVPGSADYDVAGDFIFLTNNGSSSPGLCARMDTAGNNSYCFRHISGASFELLKLVAGAGTSLVSKVMPINLNENVSGKLRIRGTTISAMLAGAEVLRATDATYSAAGRAGVRLAGTTGDAAGVHIDNFVASNPTAAQPTISSSVVATNGVWTWFHDPRALQAGRKMFVVWIDNTQKAWVKSRDLDTGAVASFTLRSTGLLSNGVDIDDHANPSIIKLPDGRLRAFYCAHSGPTMWTRKTTNPNDITTWDAETTVPNRVNGTDYTYPNPMILSGEGNRLYLFFRSFGSDTTNGGPPTLTYSDDGGTTWATPVPLIKELAGGGQRPYVKYISNGVDTIHVWTTDGHPRDYTAGGGTNIYHFFIRGGNCYKSDGTLIQALPTDMASALTFAQVTKVYDHATDGKAWTWDVALDGVGRPVGVFATIPNWTNHRYYYARWTGAVWDVHKITNAGPTIVLPQVGPAFEDQYSAGIQLNHADPSQVYLARPVDGTYEMEKWVTSDGGTTWGTSDIITRDTGMAIDIKNARPCNVRDRSTDCPEVVWHRGLFTDYSNHNCDIHAWPPFPH